MTLQEAALHYADLGYKVFPCKPGGKAPDCAHGFHDATTDLAVIEKWWTENPRRNLAIQTEGLLVIDIDGTKNEWLSGAPERQAELACGPMSYTPRGGRHHWFRVPEGKAWSCSQAAIAPKVDTRADGGYVVVAPSSTGDGVYTWCPTMDLDCPPGRLPEPPSWLILLLDRHTASKQDAASGERLEISAEGEVIPEGQRDSTLTRIGGYVRRIGLGKSEIEAMLMAINARRVRPMLDVDQVRKIAWSVSRYETDPFATAGIEGHWEAMQEEAAAAAIIPMDPSAPKDPGEFPLHLCNVPGFIGEFVQYTCETSYKPQPILALAAGISLQAVLAGRKVRDDWNTRPNIYTIGIAPSGAGKERPREVVKEILYLSGADELSGPENFASGAGVVSAVEKQPSILFQLDEIGRLLKTLGNPSQAPHLYGIITVLMRLFSSSPSIYKGDAYADAEKNKVIDQPNACIHGTTVPQSFYEGLTTENVTDGFLGRVCQFEAGNVPKQKRQMKAIPTSLIEHARNWNLAPMGGNLGGIHPTPRTIVTDPDAALGFAAFDDLCEREQERLGYPYGALWTRASEKARKLALIRACSRGGTLAVSITQEDAEWGMDVSAYLTRRLVFQASKHVSENPYDAKRKRLIRIVGEAGDNGLTMTEVAKKTGFMPSRERNEILASLKEAGTILMVKEETSAKKPTTRLKLVHHTSA